MGDEVLDMVQSMTKLSIKANRNLSMNDLYSMSLHSDSTNGASQGAFAHQQDPLDAGAFSGGSNKMGFLASSQSMNALPSSSLYAPRSDTAQYGETIMEGDEEEEED